MAPTIFERGVGEGDSGMNDQAREALIEELVGDAFAAYEGLLPKHVLDSFRAEVAAALDAHPVGSLLLRRVLPDPSVQASGDVPRSLHDERAANPTGKAGSGSG
jgi:hypothetical protein